MEKILKSKFLPHAIRSLVCLGISLKVKKFISNKNHLIKKIIGLDILKMQKLSVILALFFGVIIY